jgi:hypothetical protein
LYRYDDYSEPTKEGPLSYVLLESPFASVSTVSRGHPSLASLGTKLNAKRKYTIQKTIQISTLKDSVATVNLFDVPHSKVFFDLCELGEYAIRSK